MSSDEYKRGYSSGFADGIEAAQRALATIAQSAAAAYNAEHYNNDHPAFGDYSCEACGKTSRGIVWPSCGRSDCPHPDPTIEYPDHLRSGI
jgi:hypothetical protein